MLLCSEGRGTRGSAGGLLQLFYRAEGTVWGGIATFKFNFWYMLDQYAAPDPETRVEGRLAEGMIAEEIARMVEEEECDLIVMGRRGAAAGEELSGAHRSHPHRRQGA